MKTNSTLLAAWFFCAIALPFTTFAATFSDANWISMGRDWGVNGDVNAAVLDSSGNLYIGGRFTIVGETNANGIAKWDVFRPKAT